MPLACNINAMGRRIRLRNGIGISLIGVLLLGLAAIFGGRILWGLAVGVILLGCFMIFEARAGWCAIRAMGFNTRH